jgi:hypothetical protein
VVLVVAFIVGVALKRVISDQVFVVVRGFGVYRFSCAPQQEGAQQQPVYFLHGLRLGWERVDRASINYAAAAAHRQFDELPRSFDEWYPAGHARNLPGHACVDKLVSIPQMVAYPE